MVTIADVVLIYFEKKPAFFARIEDISADRKPDWYQVRLLILQVPLKEVVWTLREAYMNGESFTMNGQKIRLEKVEPVGGGRGGSQPEDGAGQSGHPAGNNVISLLDRKRGQ